MGSRPALEKVASRERSNANLRPNRGGEIANPEGRNQYSYRKDFESAITKMLGGEITPELLEFIPEAIRPLIQSRSDMTTGEVIALCQVVRSLGCDDKAMAETLGRLWPKVDIREHSGLDGGPLEVTSGKAWDELSGEMDRLEAREGDPAEDGEPAGRPAGGALQ